jgi:hypothetical protein
VEALNGAVAVRTMTLGVSRIGKTSDDLGRRSNPFCLHW